MGELDVTKGSSLSYVSFGPVRVRRKMLVMLAVTVAGLFAGLIVLWPEAELDVNASQYNFSNIEKPAWLKVQKTKQELLGGLDLDLDALDAISNGEIYNVSRSFSWRRPFALVDNKQRTFDSAAPAGVPKSNYRERVFTFFDGSWTEPNGANRDGLPKAPKATPVPNSNLNGELDILKVWKRAMWAAGFDPIVLGPKDCEFHVDYKTFLNSQRLSEEFKQKHRRWFAWSAYGGGIFMDYRVIPIRREALVAEDGMLSRIQFNAYGHPTLYDPIGLGLVTSSVEGTDKVLQAIMIGKPDEELRLAFDEYVDEDEMDTFAYYSEENVQVLMNNEEVSGSEVAELMNIHLHHAFVKYFNATGGIAVVDPLEEVTETLTISANDIATRLASCPVINNEKLVNICPPTQNAIKRVQNYQKDMFDYREMSVEICQNPCAVTQRGGSKPSAQPIKVKRVPQLPLLSRNTFSIVAVPHPMTVLAMTSKSPRVAVSDARKVLMRNAYLRRLTSQYIAGNTVGTTYRLLLVKDAIYQMTAVSNSIWFTWETYAGRDILPLLKSVEWDVGFTLVKDLGNLVGGGFRPATLEESEDEVTRILESSKSRVLSESGSDADKPGIEAWHLADTEIWKFAMEWSNQKIKITDKW